MRKKTWSEEELKVAIKQSASVRQVLILLNLVPAGGNYAQIGKYIKSLRINTDHFTGKGWRKGSTKSVVPPISLGKLLVSNSNFQSYKLKKRLFAEGLKQKQCEECCWAKVSEDGRLPLELDHINGDSSDNRLSNLRVLCPNCHSLKPTHRGRNKKPRWRNGRRATLKMS